MGPTGNKTKTEARQMARLIVQIRKEAAKREAFAQAVEVASDGSFVRSDSPATAINPFLFPR